MIDYSQARLLDPAWWQRCQLLQNGMTQEDDLALTKGVYDFHLALVGNSGLTEESFKKAQDRGRDTFHDMLGLVRPWDGRSAKERKERDVENMKQAYISAFGDYRDPEWQAKQDVAIAAWLSGSDNKVAQENEWDRVERLRIERARITEQKQKQTTYRPKPRTPVKQGR